MLLHNELSCFQASRAMSAGGEKMPITDPGFATVREPGEGPAQALPRLFPGIWSADRPSSGPLGVPPAHSPDVLTSSQVPPPLSSCSFLH